MLLQIENAATSPVKHYAFWLQCYKIFCVAQSIFIIQHVIFVELKHAEAYEDKNKRFSMDFLSNIITAADLASAVNINKDRRACKINPVVFAD